MDEQKAWIKSRRKRRLRITAAILALCLLVTTDPNILAAISSFAAELRGEDELMSVSGFARLPEEISEQTVPVGTPGEELTLPDMLEAYVIVEAENNTENEEKPGGGNQNKDDDEDSDNSDQNKGNKEKPDEGDDENGGDKENTDESNNGDNEGNDGNENSGGDNGNGNDGVENEDGEIPGNTEVTEDEISDTGETETADFSVQTGSFVLPEYRSENVIAVETLENKATTVKEEYVTIEGITWQSLPEYDGNAEGTYIFTAVLPEGYALAEGVSLPQITVTVQGNNEDAVVQILLDRITALPDVQEYMAKEPDIDNWESDDDAYEEAYKEWMEGLMAYAEEALAIWEEYEALTQEQQAQIPEELLTKLTAWMELAEQAAGSRNVMAAADGDLKGHANHSGWTVLYSSTNLSQGRNYYLTSDKGSITIPEGLTVNVCLNGHKMSGITVESGATLNLYDCQGGGTISPGSSGNAVIDASGDGITVNLYGGTISGTNYRGIDASGTGTTVNLYGGTVSVKNSSGVKLEDGAHLLVDGAEVKSEFTQKPSGMRAAVDIESGASAEIKSGSVSIENTVQASNVAIIWVNGGSLIVSGGTVEGTGRSYCETIWIDWGTADNYEDSHIEINGGTINAQAVIRRGKLVVNDTEIGGPIELEGVLQLKGVQSIGSAQPKYPNFLFYVNRDAGGKTGIIELTGPLTNQEPYTLQFLDISPSSKYPFTVTRNFSTYMPGKEPTAYFTYLSSGKNADHYKIILQDGEVVLLPYVMTFDANGGTLEDSTESKHVITDGKGDITGRNYMRELPEPTRDGYDFDGWYTQKEGGTEVTLDNELYEREEDITVYAHWTPIDYSITYDLNGGALPTGKTNPETYTIETTAFTLNNPERTGYTFTGWSGTGLTGNATKTVTVNKGSMGERTYTANWKAADYTVTYNKNSGTIANESSYTSYTYGTGLTLPTPTRTGYTFGGWYEDSACSGTKVTKISITDTGNKTYYAKWTADTYTITYNGLDGATLSTKPTQHTYGTATTVGNPTKTGYTFAGWKINSGSTTTKDLTLGATAYTADITLTATWTAEKYTITYSGLTNASLTTKPTQHTYGTATTVGNPTKTGYTFAGWKVNGSNTATTNLTLGATAYTADITLTATWTANTYTVTFNYQSATGGNSEQTRTVTYDSTYGTVSGTSKSLPSPMRTGYTFKGWYTQANGSGSIITDTTTVKITAAQTLYAYWKDETPPDVPVLQTGVTLPIGWTNTQDTIPLTLDDGVAVTELWVSVDDGVYTKVSGFPSGSTEYAYDAADGEHTYKFKARDAAGNESSASEAYKVMLDKTKPLIGTTLIYENKTKEFLNWIIGKKDLIIKVPVTDEGSGVEQISYTMTPIDAAGSPDNGSSVTKTAPVINGKAQITFSEDFKGTIAITCADAVGNTADSVTIGVSGGGVIVEDTAPEITVQADRVTSDTSPAQENGVELSEGYYETVPAIIVTVQDDIEGAVVAGVGAITYQVEDGAEKNVSVAADALQEQVTFTIPDSEIPTGVTVIQITATDNAGNEASKSITVKVKGPEKTPAAVINYYTEKLKALVPNAEYSINGTSYTADEEGCITIDESWFDKTLSIVKKGNDIETLDSSAQSLVIPARPDAPDAPILGSRTDSSITLQTITDAQYRIGDADWQEGTVFSGLGEKTVYSFEARYPAKENSFASLSGSKAQIATMPKPPAADELVINYVGETFAPKDGVEAFMDAACTIGVSAGNVTAYMGQTIYIRYTEKEIIPASLTTAVQIPTRPDRPDVDKTDATYPNAVDGTITGLTEGTEYEIRVKGVDGSFGAWEDAVLNGTKIENLSAGEYEVRFKAVENASFRSEAAAVTIGEIPSTQYETPNIQIGFINEKLTGFAQDAQYSIRYTGTDGREQTMDITTNDGALFLQEEWLGTTFTIVRKGNGKDKTDSEAQNLPIPQRPQKPIPVGVDVSTLGGMGKLTGLTADTPYEISTDDGRTWESKTANGSGEITGLAPGSYTVRVKAGTSNFASLPSAPVMVDDYKLTVTFVANGENYKTFSVYYGKELKDIPPVPEKKDAGDRTYMGVWCSDEQGTPADFTNITADMTVYAVYTAYYTVTLEGGTGYTLTAESGSTSPVLAGGSFIFKFALEKGYQKTKSFAIKVNGVDVELTADDTYTITNIIEDKNVTVEGVKKKAVTGKPGGGTNPGGDTDSDGGTNPGDDTDSDGGTNPGGDTDPGNGTKPGDDTNPGDGTKPGDDTKPGDGTNPNGDTDPGNGTNPGGDTKPGDGTKPGGDTKPGDGTKPGGDTKPGDGTKPGGDTNPEDGNPPIDEDVPIIPVIIKDGKIVIDGGNIIGGGNITEDGNNGESGSIATGNIPGMAGAGLNPEDGTTAESTMSTMLKLGDGAVIVTVVCEDEVYAAGVGDTVAVANVVLTPKQIQLVNDGETIEVRIDVKDISGIVTEQDKEVIESGLAEYRKEIQELTLGMYVDISMFIRIGEGDWDAVTSTEEPIEVIIGIPEELQEEGREFYIIRAHEGEYTLLSDMDNDPGTITVSTNMFSAYAIAFKQTDMDNAQGGNTKCGLCHICPTFLGICCFIWLAVIAAVGIVVVIVILRRKKETEKA